MIKYIVILSFFSLSSSAQTVEIQGKAKIADVSDASPTAQVVAIESDGTLSVMPNSSAMPPSIGDFAYGGVVFWMSTDGKHGKVVSITNIKNVAWSNVTNVNSGSSSAKNGAGNTLKITNQSGHINSAANLSIEFEYAGYSDWYLPSVDEGSLLILNYGTINTAINLHLGDQLSNFWLSNDPTSTTASCILNQGLTTWPKNSDDFNIRPVRSFVNTN